MAWASRGPKLWHALHMCCGTCMLNCICTKSRRYVTAAMRLLTATNDMKGSCTTSNMTTHDSCDDEDTMLAGCVPMSILRPG